MYLHYINKIALMESRPNMKKSLVHMEKYKEFSFKQLTNC